MNNDELLRAFEDIIQCEQTLTPEVELAGLEEWDSLAQMGMVAFFDRMLGKPVEFSALGQCATVGDLIKLAK